MNNQLVSTNELLEFSNDIALVKGYDPKLATKICEDVKEIMRHRTIEEVDEYLSRMLVSFMKQEDVEPKELTLGEIILKLRFFYGNHKGTISRLYKAIKRSLVTDLNGMKYSNFVNMVPSMIDSIDLGLMLNTLDMGPSTMAILICVMEHYNIKYIVPKEGDNKEYDLFQARIWEEYDYFIDTVIFPDEPYDP